MKRHLIALTITLLATTTLVAQGSGTTAKTATTTTQSTQTAKQKSYKTVHHVNGVVTARSSNSITVKTGSKTRSFSLTKGTRIVGSADKGAKVKIAYRANAPRVAVEIRSRA